MIALALLSASPNALELKLGIGYSLADFYSESMDSVIIDNVKHSVSYTEEDNSRWIGRIILNQNFAINNSVGIDAYFEHNSLLLRRDPQHDKLLNGQNIFGVNAVFKIF